MVKSKIELSGSDRTLNGDGTASYIPYVTRGVTLLYSFTRNKDIPFVRCRLEYDVTWDRRVCV